MSESLEWHGTREDVRSVRNRVAEVGLEFFCPDYISKNGVSVTECNSISFPLKDLVSRSNRISWEVLAGIEIWAPLI